MRAPVSTTVTPLVVESATSDPALDIVTTPVAAKGVSRRKHSKPVRNCIPRLAFRRLMREIVDNNKSDMRLQQSAVDTLQEAVESLMTERFQKCSKLAELCKLDTVRDDHWRYVQTEELAQARA